MPNPIAHAEIRSNDPDATRAFFDGLFKWTFPDGVSFALIADAADQVVGLAQQG